MSSYIAVPKTSHAMTLVATGATVKTVLQVATPSTTDLLVLAWGISFDGASGSAVPGVCVLIDVDVAATVTSLTPEKWRTTNAVTALCVGGTSATGYNGSAEGSITDSHTLDAQQVHPQSGYSIWFPEPPKVNVSRFLRIRTTFAATVNCLPWIIFQEGA